MGKMKFHHFSPLEKSFWLPVEKFTIAPTPEKIPPTPMVVEAIQQGFQESFW